MQAVKRYILLSVSLILLIILFVIVKQKLHLIPSEYYLTKVKAHSLSDERSYVHILKSSPTDAVSSPFVGRQRKKLTNFSLSFNNFKYNRDHVSQWIEKTKSCTMATCFDFSLCTKGFKIYVYPESGTSVTGAYHTILTTLRSSKYYTADASDACIFVLAIDTLTRDELDAKAQNLVDIENVLKYLQPWNRLQGKNHVVFNFFVGTWPDYLTTLDFNYGFSVLAKTGVPVQDYRKNFDISLPLIDINSEEHAGSNEPGQAINVPFASSKYLLTFRGKRYLNGKGSRARDSLYHLHNGRDIILVTTCRHGPNWQKMKDARCREDNEKYDNYDFKKLMSNSSFCLVPRGRRLGTYRFLEALQVGCIPVLLNNDLVLPFSEVIDWNQAVVYADERLLFQVPSLLRGIPTSRRLAMWQQTQFLWEAYFSSTEKIVNTAVTILHDRVLKHFAHSHLEWNSVPGALVVHRDFSDTLSQFPFYYKQLGKLPENKFTVVIYATTPVFLTSSPLFRLIRTLFQSVYVKKIVVVWHCEVAPPERSKWPQHPAIPVIVITNHIQTVSARFYPYKVIDTDAVLSLNEEVPIVLDEIEFGFAVWKEYPERIVGYSARNHFWDESHSRWGYTSKQTNQYSMILTSAAFYHRLMGFFFLNDLQKRHKMYENGNNKGENISDFIRGLQSPSWCGSRKISPIITYGLYKEHTAK